MPATRVSLPPENLADGKLTIQLHPGRIAGLSMRDAAQPDGPVDERWGSWRNAFPASAGDLLNIRDLEQGVEQMNRLPSQSVRTRIEPGADEDSSNVVIDRQTGALGERVRGVALDNAGGNGFFDTPLDQDMPMPFGDAEGDSDSDRQIQFGGRTRRGKSVRRCLPT